MSQPDNQEWTKAYMDEYLDSRNDMLSQQSLCSREPKSWGRQRVSITKSIMVCWSNEGSACVYEGISRWKKASVLLIYIRLFWKLQKLDILVAIAAELVALYWRLTCGKHFSVLWHGRWQGVYSTARLVARACTWRSCSPASQQRLWHQASRTKVTVAPWHLHISGWMV